MNFSDTAIEIGGAVALSGMAAFCGYKVIERLRSDWWLSKARAKRPEPFSTIKARLDAMNDVSPQ